MITTYTKGIKPIEFYIDDEDEYLLARKWYPVYCKNGRLKSIITNGNSCTSSGKRMPLYLHREIMHLEVNDGKVVDHIDGNVANNCKSNLRICTQHENSMNRQINLNSTSGYKGASWNTYHKKWAAYIKLDKKKIFLGYYDDPKDAHEAYCIASEKYHGEFGRTE